MILDHLARLYATLIMKDEKNFKDIKNSEVKEKTKDILIKKGAPEDKYVE